MAKRRKLGVNPVVRSIIRGGVRGSLTDDDILSDVQSSFPAMHEDDLKKMIVLERSMQSVISGVMEEDKRTNVDLARRLKCPKGTKRVRIRITITFPSGPGGESRTFGDTVEVDARGRLADLLNEALRNVISRAVGFGYNPPHMTSSDTSGSIRYRIERMDCA
jgi:hypothetical protein